MLQLKNITKVYTMGKDLSVNALKGVSINFRKSEFVSILGPSGCGKTTLLNIIGGLDHYSSGDLIINGTSTKSFKDRDWDDYRNKSVGFVFQSYNLIPHINLLSNVAMGLTLSGVKNKERNKLAKEALEKVGLGKEIKKKPNQLSGGQMQRVAIARAIVGNPDIILADEPTGALDSETGVQVMEILKEISKEKLVIMVTHNGELADSYSDRIIRISDGCIIDDSKPYSDEKIAKDQEKELKNINIPKNIHKNHDKRKKSKMSVWTAFNLSARTLLSKKGRTIITSIAGSIGIFAISLIVAISSGMTRYVNNIQDEALGTSAVSITETAYILDQDEIMKRYRSANDMPEYPNDKQEIYPYTEESIIPTVKNNITAEYVDYIKNMDSSLTKTIEFQYATKMNIAVKSGDDYKFISTSTGGLTNPISQLISNKELIENSYDVLSKDATSLTGIPQNKNELALVVDKYNRLSSTMLYGLGFDISSESISFDKIIGREFKYIPNDVLYSYDSETEKFNISTDYESMYNDENSVSLKIVSILRIKNDNAVAWLSEGIVYSPELTSYILENAKQSAIGIAQIANTTKNVITGSTFTDTGISSASDQYTAALKYLSVYSQPTAIYIYPSDINAKVEITDYLKAWNTQHPDNEIVFTDFAEIAFNALAELINVISYILIAFCAISLIVSTVMISVTTYTSVIERTKEIGVLRAMGARKVDIASIFNAETVIIGFFAGVIGVAISGLFAAIINIIITQLAGIGALVHLSLLNIVIMIALSTFLTLLAGLIPSSIAAKKDPVECLRSE